MKIYNHTISNNNLFEYQLFKYFQYERNIIFLNNNDVNKRNLFAFSKSDENIDKQWKFGFISYDYKNQLEALSSNNFDGIQFPKKLFFSPEILFKIGISEVEISYQSTIYSIESIKNIIIEIQLINLEDQKLDEIKVVPRITKEEYINNVYELKRHIHLGDIYEVNFCQEFFAKNISTDPIELYLKLNRKSPTPFSCFVKCDTKYLMSASPERFINKKKDNIMSQPIKGTIKRGENKKEDEQLKKELYADRKERSENVMIVDLVRNDLSKIAKRNSVKVDELCGIYSFPQVHQMISTVSGDLKSNIEFDDIIAAMFPMGSMTGAPKVKAMELIEEYEKTKRGLYSGTVGYIDDRGDFDFNVVIRSILYNEENNYLSFIVGGAITDKSDPEKEYEECLLKAKAMLEVLS